MIINSLTVKPARGKELVYYLGLSKNEAILYPLIYNSLQNPIPCAVIFSSHHNYEHYMTSKTSGYIRTLKLYNITKRNRKTYGGRLN